MKIRIDQIQPSEEYLTKEIVDRLFQDGSEFTKCLSQIDVFQAVGQPFNYFVIDRENFLYVAHKKGISIVQPRVVFSPHEYTACEIAGAREIYELGIRRWDDFDGRILSGKEITKIYEERGKRNDEEFKKSTGIDLRNLKKDMGEILLSELSDLLKNYN